MPLRVGAVFLRFKRFSFKSWIVTHPTKENPVKAKSALNNWLSHTQMLKILKHTKIFWKMLAGFKNSVYICNVKLNY